MIYLEVCKSSKGSWYAKNKWHNYIGTWKKVKKNCDCLFFHSKHLAKIESTLFFIARTVLVFKTNLFYSLLIQVAKPIRKLIWTLNPLLYFFSYSTFWNSINLIVAVNFCWTRFIYLLMIHFLSNCSLRLKLISGLLFFPSF